MYEIFLIAGMLACACAVGFVADGLRGEVRLLKRNMQWGSLMLRGLSVLLFLCYLPYLFSLEEISNQVGLADSVYTPVQTVLLALLKWATYFTFAVAMMQPFYNKQNVKDYVAFFAPVVLILNAIFLKPFAVVVTGDALYTDYRIVFHAICLCLTACLSGSTLVSYAKNKGFAEIGKRLYKALLFVGIWFMAFMPMYFVMFRDLRI